ncbi:DUF1700 domain-containing protein [Streptococcus ovis]|uniref:DUF1700 domain-containing protein n=1 Tax=Streptococcus ovis TaxID=82806 RepID=UPI000366706A|nr:DUF1700 domain-containing protein [Streptococcus ovis]
MRREAYLIALEGHLKKLSKSDVEDTMRYFRELFDDAGPEGEEELIASLGDPKIAASDVVGDLLDKKIEEAKTYKDKLGVVRFALLAIAAAPVGFIVLLILLLILFTILAFFVAILIAIFGAAVTMLGLCGAFLWESVTHFQTLGILFFNLGGALVSLGLALLVFIIGVWASKWVGRGIVRLAQCVYRKVEKNG